MVRFCSCRPLFCDQKTAEHITPTVAADLLWQLSNIYHAGLPGIYLPPGLTRRRQVLRSISESMASLIFTSIGLSPVPYRVRAPGAAGT